MIDLRKNKSLPTSFGDRLLVVIFGIVACYLAINIWVIEGCKAHNLHQERSMACSVAEHAKPFKSIIPAIYRPVRVIMERGNPIRADLVASVYSFAWASFLVFEGAILLLITGRVLLLTQEEKDNARIVRKKSLDDTAHILRASRRNKTFRKDKFIIDNLMNVAIFFLFIQVFYGIYEFDTWSLLENMVHVRNRDLYMIAVYFSFLQLFLGVLFVSWQLERIASDSNS
jgi:hypothetical protein